MIRETDQEYKGAEHNRIKNFEGWSTSSEETPECFGAKGALSFKNENIMCDTSTQTLQLVAIKIKTEIIYQSC